MVTVRTYSNPTTAGLAKSLLDNYEIPCALLHENANLLYPFAMPSRLLVDDDQVDRAIQILNGNLEKAEEIETREDADETSINGNIAPEIPNQNPWELLVLAFYLVVPAICILQTKFPIIAKGSRARYLIARVTVTHFLSWLAVAFAAVLVVLYFRVRRSSAKSQAAETPEATK
jgi:hypothetical protein